MLKMEKSLGGVPFLELYQMPNTMIAWATFALIRLLFLVSIALMVGWSVFNGMTTTYFLLALLVTHITVIFLRRAYSHRALRNALVRWTSIHLDYVISRPALHAELLSRSASEEGAFQDWIATQIRILYAQGVHPDYYRFDHDLAKGGHE
jgi:hypothetical protein